MGCLTGIITKSFLVAFNVVVAVSGIIVLTLASLIQTTLNGYGDEIPQDPQDVLIGLQTASTCIICLGALGVVVSCCCGNKLFLYTYFILGLILVIITLVFASMGAANINNEKYQNEIKKNMDKDFDEYDCDAMSPMGELETKMDQIYRENQCCGVISAKDFEAKCNETTIVPAGCCSTYVGEPCNSDDVSIYWTGCYDKLMNDVGDQAQTTFSFAIFFGVMLFALLTSTCLCVKCTDTMPI
jgi:multisubunit Na+/H+ antiporter MnhG subunit